MTGVQTCALPIYAGDHQDQLPNDFEPAKAYVAKEVLSATNVTTEQFEIVYQGTLTSITNPSKVVVLREKQAHQAPDGKWSKAYGFGDGHAEIHSEPDGNFDAWEKEHILAPAASSQ